MIEKLIFGDRQSGKTTELIKESARTGAYIVVSCKNEARDVFRLSKELGLNIPYPLTVNEMIYESPSSYIFQKGILIDNLERILCCLFNYITIHAATIDIESSQIEFKVQEIQINKMCGISEGEEKHERDNDETCMH